jgi:uncharacterized membrane protein YcaP (DUF421 family)
MEIIVRATVIFFFLFLLTRGLKKRALADMAPFELLLLVTLGDIVQQGITQEDHSLTGAMLAASTMAFWVSVLTYLTWRSRRIGTLLDGVPLVIVQDGRPVDRAMAVERLPLDELLESARQQGIDSLAKVRVAVLEPSGRISFIKYDT